LIAFAPRNGKRLALVVADAGAAIESRSEPTEENAAWGF
jgi:hypothetical protein